eukprot:5808-Pelagococcus_subviridis.AAC.2
MSCASARIASFAATISPRQRFAASLKSVSVCAISSVSFLGKMATAAGEERYSSSASSSVAVAFASAHSCARVSSVAVAVASAHSCARSRFASSRLSRSSISASRASAR